MYRLLPGYLSPFTFTTSSTNFVSQKFRDSSFILAIFVSNDCTLAMSISNERCSFEGSLLALPICHSEKTLKDHFVDQRVDFGILSCNVFFSSSLEFGGLNSRFGGMFLLIQKRRTKRLHMRIDTDKVLHI